jgi:hypothetical protein
LEVREERRGEELEMPGWKSWFDRVGKLQEGGRTISEVSEIKKKRSG